MSETDSGPVDFTRIQETSEGDVEFEQELFGVFVEDCAERISLLATALKEGNEEAVRLESHTIKGAGSNVGTTELHLLAAQLEKVDASEYGSAGTQLLSDMESEFGRVKSAIESYLAQS